MRGVAALLIALASGGCAAADRTAPRPGFVVSGNGGAPVVGAGEALVVGEMHGSREIPEAFLQLVRQAAERGRVVVGLELPPSTEGLPCSGTASLPRYWIESSQDGRTSEAMRALVCALREPRLARRIDLVHLDDETRGDDFDVLAAARFRERLVRRGGIGLILTGSYHARNVEGSMAAELRRFGSVVHTAIVSSPAVETWHCTAAGCGPAAARLNFCSRFPEAAAAARWIPLGQPGVPWDYCWSLPRLTPSPPASSPDG